MKALLLGCLDSNAAIFSLADSAFDYFQIARLFELIFDFVAVLNVIHLGYGMLSWSIYCLYGAADQLDHTN